MSIRRLCSSSTPIHRPLFLAVNQRSSSPYRHPKVCPALARFQHAPARMADARFQHGREKRNHSAVKLTWMSRPSADTGCVWRMSICANTSQHTDMHAPTAAANRISTTQIINWLHKNAIYDYSTNLSVHFIVKNGTYFALA